MAAYKDKIEKAQANLSSLEIRANKCERSHKRNLDRCFQRREAAYARNVKWQKLSPQEQIASLKKRRGHSKKQIAKIMSL